MKPAYMDRARPDSFRPSRPSLNDAVGVAPDGCRSARPSPCRRVFRKAAHHMIVLASKPPSILAFLGLVGLAAAGFAAASAPGPKTPGPFEGKWRKVSTSECGKLYPDELEFFGARYLGRKGRSGQTYIVWDA